jgi:hypothetical protein
VLSALFTNSHTCAFKREELYSDSGAVPPRQSMLDNLLDSWAYFEFPPITAQDRELFLKHASAPFLYADQPVDISSFLRFFTSFFRLNIGFNEEGFVRAGIQVAVHFSRVRGRWPSQELRLWKKCAKCTIQMLFDSLLCRKRYKSPLPEIYYGIHDSGFLSCFMCCLGANSLHKRNREYYIIVLHTLFVHLDAGREVSSSNETR